MKEIDKKKQIDAEWDRQYNLNQQQLKELIAAKFERAKMYQEATKPREALHEESR